MRVIQSVKWIEVPDGTPVTGVDYHNIKSFDEVMRDPAHALNIVRLREVVPGVILSHQAEEALRPLITQMNDTLQYHNLNKCD